MTKTKKRRRRALELIIERRKLEEELKHDPRAPYIRAVREGRYDPTTAPIPF